MKCPLWPTATKLESVGTKIFLLKVDQESCEWKRICQILILTLWLVILCPPCPPCFLPKTAQTVQKITVFSWKGRGDWALILTYLDNPIAEIFPHYSQNFLISAIFRGKREVKIGPKCKLWVRLFSIKTQILQKLSSQSFCLLEHYLWWECRQNWTIPGGVWVQKPNTIMSLHESVNQKPFKAINSFFWLNF